jgi:hypothetical protein
MKLVVVSLFAFLLVAAPCSAIKVAAFTDTNTFVEHAQDILIAKCLGPVPDGTRYFDGLYPVGVEVLAVVKAAGKAEKGEGAQKPGRMKIATIYRMEAGKIYLLTSFGGSAYDTNFLAVPELSVVEVPANFKLGDLTGKTVVQQVQAVFAARRQENERQQRLLREEKKLLDRAVGK